MFLQNAIDFLPILLKGAVITIEITACAFVLSSILGLALAQWSVKSLVDQGFWRVSASGAPLTIGVQKGLSEPSSLNCLSVPCSV